MKKFKALILALILSMLFSFPAFAGELTFPFFCWYDSSGYPLASGNLYSYVSGTSTPKLLYSDKATTTPHTNPEILDTNGCTEIYGLGTYTLTLKDSTDTTTYFSIDGVVAGGQGGQVSYYYPNYAAADQGATGDNDTIKYAIDTCSTDACTIYLANNSGSARTEYILDTDETAGSTIKFVFEEGAELKPASGDTLTAYSPAHIKAGPRQQIIDTANNSTNPLLFTAAGTAYPGWGGTTVDGSTDDLTEIQVIVTAVGNIGGTVHFPYGKYAIAGGITIKDNVWLTSDRAEIELKANGDAAIFANDDQSGGNTNIRIIGFHLDGNKSNQGAGSWRGIDFRVVTDVYILDNYVEDCDEVGIHVLTGERFYIRGNTVTTSGTHGIAGHTGTKYIISNNIAFSNASSGIITPDSTDFSVVNNQTYSNGTTTEHHGIYGDGTSYFIIANNIAHDNAGDGIKVQDTLSVSITGNHSYSNTRFGIGVATATGATNSYSVAVTGNVTEDNGSHGISIQGKSGQEGDFATVTGNVSKGDVGRGINIDWFNNVTISGNTIEGSGEDGILLQDSDECVISGNVIKDGSQASSGTDPGIGLEESTTNVIVTGNMVIGTDFSAGVKEAGTANENYIIDNVLQTVGTFEVVILGAGTIAERNRKSADIFTALADNATPNVYGHDLWLTGGTTTITDFDNGIPGQIIKVIAEHSLDITDGTNIFLSGSANWSMTATDTLTLVQKLDGLWYEISRSDSGA